MLQWNLYNETREVTIKTHQFHHLPGKVSMISCLFSLSWKTIGLERQQNLVIPLYRFHSIMFTILTQYLWIRPNIYELDPIFMNILFTLNNKPYDTRSGSLITQSQVKTIKHGINSFVYQGGKQWNALPADAKDIEDLNVFKNYIDKWTGPDCHCGYCVLCAIKTL